MSSALRKRGFIWDQPLQVLQYGQSQCRSWSRPSSTLAKLSQEMLARPVRVYRDWPTRTPTDLLNRTLSDFFSRSNGHSREDLLDESSAPLGYHLIYFPVPETTSALLPDGTDALHSPGSPFTRRMWAGGRIASNPEHGIHLHGLQYVCQERIVDVQFKGPEADEKVFVKIRRWVGPEYATTVKDGYIGDISSSTFYEDRTLVFLRDRPSDVRHPQRSSEKILKPPDQPDYSLVITPTAQLLFRFSALTWNAHRIHLDKQYCQDVEGHRNLLVHGPLSVILMLRTLKEYIRTKDSTGAAKGEVVKQIEYKNLAPLYAEEPMRICVKRRKEEANYYDVWIEGKDGGYAVKAKAETISAVHNDAL